MLETFVAVAEEGGFTRAAGRLHLVQSSVSAAIKSLERGLGFRLFEREGRGVRLTPEGRSFLPSARAAVAALGDARDTAVELAGGVAGTVSVGVLAIPDMIDVAHAIARLHALHPGVRIEVRSASSGGGLGLVRDVLAGHLDLCVLVLPIPVPPEIEVQRLISGRYVLTCGADHPLAQRGGPIPPEALDGQDFVEFPEGFSTRLAVDAAFAEAGIRRRTRIEVTHLELIATYVAAGLGIGFITEELVASRSDLIPLDAPWLDLRWTIALARRRDRRVSRAAATFLREIEENCRRGIEAGRFQPAAPGS